MKNFLIIFSLTLLLLPTFIFAYQGYQPLVGIPNVNPNTDFDKYINALYALSISIAALLAVIKIIIAGVKWMMTDVVPAKGEAKKDIQGALIGLLVVLAAVLILTVINPNLLKVDLKMDPVLLKKYTPSTHTFSAAPVETHIGYDAVDIVKNPGLDSKELQAFEDGCTDSGGQYVPLKGTNFRCYTKQPNQTVSVKEVCTSANNDEVCKDNKAAARKECLKTGGVSYTPDSEKLYGSTYGTCIRNK